MITILRRFLKISQKECYNMAHESVNLYWWTRAHNKMNLRVIKLAMTLTLYKTNIFRFDCFRCGFDPMAAVPFPLSIQAWCRAKQASKQNTPRNVMMIAVLKIDLRFGLDSDRIYPFRAVLSDALFFWCNLIDEGGCTIAYTIETWRQEIEHKEITKRWRI